MRMALLQQGARERCVALPNIAMYYQAALLENMLQWWDPSAKQCWRIEQLGLDLLLTEWILNISFFPTSELEECASSDFD